MHLFLANFKLQKHVCHAACHEEIKFGSVAIQYKLDFLAKFYLKNSGQPDHGYSSCWKHFCFRTFQATYNYNSISVLAKDFPRKTISTMNISPGCSFVDGFSKKKTPIFHGFSRRKRCDLIAENVL